MAQAAAARLANLRAPVACNALAQWQDNSYPLLDAAQAHFLQLQGAYEGGIKKVPRFGARV
jgi:hypothetical protein